MRKLRTIGNFAFRLRRGLARRMIRWSGNPRPSSYPYVSGDTFRAFADPAYDSAAAGSFDPERVAPGSAVFVASPMAEEFFRTVHPKIRNRYVLVTHNGDTQIDGKLAAYADEKIIAWYAMSVLVKHPKIIPIPAGLENLSYYNNGITRLFDRFRKENRPKRNRVLFGFTIGTNPAERQPAYDFLSAWPLADEIREPLMAPQYLDRLAGYGFVAAPPGNAIESHRMWEAMYLGVVPIVKRSAMMEYFRSLGLPFLLIDDWRELAPLAEADLERLYRETTASADISPLFADYWFERIKESKRSA